MGYLTANDRAGEHAKSWYAETAGPLPEHGAIHGEAEADVCIVGAGYAGLSAALHLAERGLTVRVLEAHRVGWGASGRNGGQVGIGPRADIQKYEQAAGLEDASKVWDIAISANRLVRSLVQRHNIDCDLTDGFLECGVKPSHAAEAQEFADHLATHYDHDKIRNVDRAEMAEMLGTERYHGGFVDMQGAHIHPLNYALGLARAAVEAGAIIHENSPVTGVEKGQVKTATGTVKAANILLACNGYLDGLSPRAQRRVLPINNFIIATEPMGENRARSINRDNVAVCDSFFVLNYFRLTPDRRMLWGGGESTGVRFPTDLTGLVRKRMLAIYPDLEDLEITHAWGGTLGITGTRFPLFHDLGQGIRTIGGWSGSGIHMATMGGKIAADAIAGEIGDWDVLARMPTPQFPGGDWFRMPLLRLAMFWYGLRDRL